MNIYWINKKEYNHKYIKKIIMTIKNKMINLLPISNSEYNKMLNISQYTKIGIEDILSIRNLLKIQLEIYSSQKINSNTIIKKKIINNINELLVLLNHQTNNDNKKNLINKFFHNEILPFPLLLSLINSEINENIDIFFQNYINDIKKKIYEKEQISKEESKKFEEMVECLFKKNKIEFKTESDIKLESNNMSNATPDILFETPINIIVNGINNSINWIDAKNYILINTPFILKKLEIQAKKYNKIFGNGAFVFHYGYDVSIKIKNVLILDGSFLD